MLNKAGASGAATRNRAFGQLVSAVGLRDASVPEPDMVALFGLGAFLLAVMRKRESARGTGGLRRAAGDEV